MNQFLKLRKSVSALFLLCVLLVQTNIRGAESFELQDGDRVVFLGDALIEQEQYAGWIEVMMTTAFPERDVTFRNLGWSADTPSGKSRFGLSLLPAGREPAGEGWRQLVKQLKFTQPTVIVFGYGMASALDSGMEGVAAFTQDYQRLVDTAKQMQPDLRCVLLSPLGRRADQSRTIQTDASVLTAYRKAVNQVADNNDGVFVDLSDVAIDDGLRKDPIHLNDAGYREAAIAIGQALGFDDKWISNAHVEALRSTILKKNVWWFHRSRPANMAYVFGFRKREQGQNAVEIPQYDQLIVEEEQAIALLRKLDGTSVQSNPARTDSQYATFTKQATPQFTVGENLEVSLWAENPQLNKPIQMNFDAGGRLWVASSEAYPMIEVGQAAPDKILILEDTNADGKADTSTVFADGLLIPTGVEPGDGGCYVAQSTDLLFLKDTNGDGKADLQQRVLSGFGTEDTHHNLHTLRWGPDGRLYMNQSIYTRTDTETPRGVVRLKAGGGFRYNTSTMRMEVVFRGLVNSWGHQFDDFGQSFLTDGAGFSGIAYSFPGAAFKPTPGAKRVLGLISPGSYPKFASAEIIAGNSFPPEWQGSVITCDFRANRVTRFSLKEQGAGFVTTQEDDLLRTASSTFRPIDVKQGPDGALYIADWSNPIINHGEVDFRDERRDRWHGRIWRVAWKGGVPKEKEDLTKVASKALLDRLISNDRYTRDQARRVLLERDDLSEKQVHEWTKASSDEYQKLQGVWLQQGLDIIDFQDVRALVSADDPKVRSAAMRIVSDLVDPATDSSQPVDATAALEIYRQAVMDEHPRVRLEAIRGLGKLKTAEAASVALISLNLPRDRFLDFALATTMDELADVFMVALDQGHWKPDSPAREKQLEFALASIDSRLAASYLSKRLANESIPANGAGPWIELIAQAGGKTELTKLFKQVVRKDFEGSVMVRAINALATAQRVRKQKPAGDLNQIRALLELKDPAVKLAAMRLIGVWQMKKCIGLLAELATEEAEASIQSAAMQSLQEIGQPSVPALARLVRSKNTGVRRQAVICLAALNPQGAAKPFYHSLAEIQNEQELLDFWRQVLVKKNTGKVLAKHIPSTGITEMAALAGLTAARDAGRNEPELIAVISPYANVTKKAQELTPDRVAELIDLVEHDGQPARGEAVYSREDMQCMTCHAIGGVGGKVGPDMTSLGASAPIDYLIESIYKPNAKIKENYHSVNILTVDGLVLTGIIVGSDNNEVILRDARNKLVRIPKDDIEFQKPGKSLMPEGLVDRLTQQEQVDLIKFLTQLGRPGNYDASKGGVARVYEVFTGTQRADDGNIQAIMSETQADQWVPFLSRVNGSVAGVQLARKAKVDRSKESVDVYLKTDIEVATGGGVTLSANGADAADLWVDSMPIEGDTNFTTELAAGKHTVVIRLDGKKIPASFRFVSRDVTFLTDVEGTIPSTL
ncbi:MAG: c-type cytochrome [Planctomycetaceae bacterium]|nr:c-type cytochrome [Planctomycetaceae bacterium]